MVRGTAISAPGGPSTKDQYSKERNTIDVDKLRLFPANDGNTTLSTSSFISQIPARIISAPRSPYLNSASSTGGKAARIKPRNGI